MFVSSVSKFLRHLFIATIAFAAVVTSAMPAFAGTASKCQSEDVPANPTPPTNPPTGPTECKAMFFFYVKHRGDHGDSRYHKNGQNLAPQQAWFASGFAGWASLLDGTMPGYPNTQNYTDYFVGNSKCNFDTKGWSWQDSRCSDSKNLKVLPAQTVDLFIDPCNRNGSKLCAAQQQDVPEYYDWTDPKGNPHHFHLLSGPASYQKPATLYYNEKKNDPSGDCVMGLDAGTVSPLVIDLDNEGITFTDIGSNVMFDLGVGLQATHWVSNTKSVAFLAVDSNKNGKIDNYTELFGDHTPGPDKKFSRDGFLSLAKYDFNKDKKIDKDDGIFKRLLVWNDLNGDGVSQPEELKSLSAYHIASISLAYDDDKMISHDQSGDFVRGVSKVTFDDGKTRQIYDIWLQGATDESVKGASAAQLSPNQVPMPGAPEYEKVEKVYSETLKGDNFRPAEFEYSEGKQQTLVGKDGKVSGYQMSWQHKFDTCWVKATFTAEWQLKESKVNCTPS